MNSNTLTKDPLESIKYLTPDRKERWEYLSQARELVSQAINHGNLFLRMTNAEPLRDENYRAYRWQVKIEDNLGGLSFLHVPTLDFVRKSVKGASRSNEDLKKFGPGNSIISSWYGYWTDGGNEWADEYYVFKVRLYNPAAFLIKKPVTHVVMYAENADMQAAYLNSFKKKLTTDFTCGGTVFSPLQLELNQLIKDAEVQMRDVLAEENRQKQLAEDSEKMKKLGRRLF